MFEYKDVNIHNPYNALVIKEVSPEDIENIKIKDNNKENSLLNGIFNFMQLLLFLLQISIILVGILVLCRVDILISLSPLLITIFPIIGIILYKLKLRKLRHISSV